MVRTEIEQFSLQSGRCHLVGTRANVHGRQRGLLVAFPTINAFGFHYFVFTSRFRLYRCRCRTRSRVLKQGSRRLAWFFRVRWIQHKRRRSQQELSRFHLIVVERKERLRGGCRMKEMLWYPHGRTKKEFSGESLWKIFPSRGLRTFLLGPCMVTR